MTNGTHPTIEYEFTEYEGNNEAANQYIEQCKKALSEARDSLEKTKTAMKIAYDRHRREQIHYQPGDKVWLDGRNIPTHRPMKKLDEKYYGPFDVISKVGSSSYKLRIPGSWRIYPVFNESLLKPHIEPAFPNQNRETRPPPEIINEEEEYEVEKILAHRIHNNVIEYLIHWKGYSNEERTWEPEENLTNARTILNAYKRSLGH